VTNPELDFVLDGRKRAQILRYFLGEISEVQLEEHGKRKDDFFQDLEMVIAIEDEVSGIGAAKLRCVGVSIHQPAAGADCVIDNFLGDAKVKLEVILQRSSCGPSR
jgi:hypothetical protein